MSRKRMTVTLALLLVLTGSTLARADEPPAQDVERTPARVSFTSGEVSFWRAGGDEWVPAQLNTPLAPGDALYAGDRANLELQIGARAYVRAGANTQLGIENEEPDLLQVKVTTGHASIDLRSLPAGHTIELDTPSAAFTIERTGYYRVDVSENTTTFITRRGGSATVIPANGQAVAIAPSEEVVVQGTETPQVETYVAPEVDAWDRWNYDRTDRLIEAISARYVSPGVYGVDALDHYGTWRVVPTYGSVWVPAGLAPGWAPYSTGRWIWDPYYGWTWIDTAPWGWAPYHYGRWVHTGGFWGWAPGPIVAGPVYAPALVAFFGGGGVSVGVGIGGPPVGWCALSWGEPLVPWWGRAGFIGRPWWGGWGGPHVVNNVVIEQTTVVNVTNITYRNVNVNHAVVVMRGDRFGRGPVQSARLTRVDVQHLEPIRGALPMRPDRASLVPATGRAARPPEAAFTRRVVVTRAPHDTIGSLREQGLNVSPAVSAPAPRVVPRPQRPAAGVAAERPPFGEHGTAERRRPALPPRFERSRPGAPAQQMRRMPAEAEPRPAGAPPAPVAPAQRENVAPHAPAQPHIPAGEHQPPAAMGREAPAVRAPVAPAPVAPAPVAPAPVAPAPQRLVPQAPPARHEPPMQAPRREPEVQAPRREAPRESRQLPGEPANRMYSRPEVRHAPPERAAPPPQVHSAPPAGAPHGRPEPQGGQGGHGQREPGR